MSASPHPSLDSTVSPTAAKPARKHLRAVPKGEPGGAAKREDERLAALDRYDVLDTPAEDAFDRITRLAQKVFRVPIAAVSLIDGHRQWVKSGQGLSATEVSRRDAFCSATIEQSEPLVIADLRQDPRFASWPFVMGEAGMRFYAGIALRSSDGHNIGTLCAMDTKPRQFGPEELDLLTDLANLAMDEMELRVQANRDGLTGASTRRAFKEGAVRAVSLALRHHEELSCIGFDLDHFKRINDTFGHAAGDRVLAGAARACAGALRATDLIGRIGGEEFGVLMPKTGIRDALKVAEKIRKAIAKVRFEFDSQAVQVTASFGVAALDATTRDLDTLLAHADTAVYEAKHAGRDRVVAWKADEEDRPVPKRRRVLKGGQILFNGRASIMDCTVRSLSDEGAGIDVSSSVGVPPTFALAIKADGFERQAEVISQTERHIEVAFV